MYSYNVHVGREENQEEGDTPDSDASTMSKDYGAVANDLLTAGSVLIGIPPANA
jgi:hypothetical protein